MSSQQLQYRPTTLERAYASHLLQTYFQTPPTPNSDTTPLRVSGRQAVPFLTTSGVERTLLRLFWSVADPEAVGTLVIRNQFHVLLRLVAMAQAHFLPPLTTSANNDGRMMTDVDKIEILTNTLQDNAHLVIALPTFSADTSCPSVAYLLGTFPSVVTAKENSMLDYSKNSGNNIGGNNVDISSMLTNHDLQYQLWQQQNQQQQNQQQQDNSQGGEQNNNMMSVSDAFGSLPEVEDRPLPPLQFDTPTTTTTPSAALEDVKSLPLSTVVDNGDVTGEGELNNDLEEVSDEGFGDFDDSNNPMQSTNEGMGSDVNPTFSTAAVADVVENDEDDFGGFESTPNNYNNDSDVKTESSAEDDSNEAENADSGFGDFSDSFPPPVPAVAEMTPPENNAAQGSVANTAEQTPEIALGNSVGNTLSMSDAFGLLVNQEDPPIQFGEMNAFGGVAGDANVVNDSDNVEEEDDFGNFGSADTTAAAAPVVEETKGHNNEDFNEGPTASSVGMSVFDAFGDVEDKPLPPLGGFPSIANELGAPNSEEAEVDDDGFGFGSFEATVEAEPSNDDAPGDDNFGTFEDAAVTTEIEAAETGDMEVNNDESFGTFGMVETKPNADAPADDSFGTFADAAMSTVETPNVDTPVEDSFGTFEGLGEETAEPEPVVDDSFGTFEGVAHETGQTEGSVDAPVEDSFGTFEGVAEETAETRPIEVETLVEDSFGTFEGVGGEGETADMEQNIASQSEVPAISFGLPSPSPSDPFGALPEVENLPLPPFTSPPFVERKLEDVALEVEENTPDSENDDFGDFGSVPVDDGSCDVLHLESKQMDEDDFGGFESTTPQVQANEDVFGSATDNTNDNTSSARSEVENDVDDFGDFGEAQVSAPPLDTASMAIDSAENANNIVDTEDDFGDFGEAQVPAPPLVTASTNIDTTTKNNDEDDFGDFGEAQVSAPPLDTASMDIDAAANANNTDDTDDDFGFGDWGSGDWQGQAPEGNESASALVPDILSGGFDAFSDPAPESTAIAATDEQATPTTPNGEYDDEFGSFEAPESGVTQDEGTEGFVFVENTESNSQVDAFGDFSSPASESFSAFDSGANEDKIMQPKLEEDNADGFGDFSSFDNGAQQLEEVKEGSQKISLSRQELIGSEYTNLMERWASIVSTVKSDVERGQKIIEYISKTLPSSDRAIIFKSSKLQNHVLGLAEFVRVVRCIAATIADVFCLSDSIDLQAPHLPEWNDNPIIADAITIETLWSEINSRVIELGVLPRPPQLETVVEIRGRANIATVQQKTDLCHLTLQPFVDKPCTQSSVDWNGHKYMACAANLLLHRMS